MFFLLSKILLFLIKPLIWIIVLVLLSIFSKNRKRKRSFLLGALFLLLIFSNAYLVGHVLNAYEAKYPPLKKYDVGIVLGGYSNLNDRNGQIEFGFAGDRLFQAISLYKSGRIQKFLISGGSANLIDNKIKEGDLVIKYLKQIGIPDSAILNENQSRNTIENAKNSLALLKKTQPDAKILVISSAFHLPRVKLIFSRFQKENIDYYPTNYIGKTDYDFLDFMIPDVSALSSWELLFKEWIGLLVDQFRS